MYPEDTALFATIVNNGSRINIPLVCQKCGKCCGKLSHVLFDGEEIDVEGIEQVKEYLGVRYYEVVEELKEKLQPQLDEVGGTIIVNPCPFLHNEGCEAYPARSRSCRQFPLYGDQGIGCSALHRFKKVVEYMGGDVTLNWADWTQIAHFKATPSLQLVERFLQIAERKEIELALKLNWIDGEDLSCERNQME